MDENSLCKWGPQSFCDRVNLLNEDLNVGAYSLRGGEGASGCNSSASATPPKELALTFRSSFKRLIR